MDIADAPESSFRAAPGGAGRPLASASSERAVEAPAAAEKEPPPKPVEELPETIDPAAAKAKRRRRLFSIFCILVITLLGDSARGLILPTQLQYVRQLGGDERALGATVALFSAGRLVFSPALGAVADRVSFTFAMRFALVLVAAGNVLYILVPRLWAMLLARFVVGCGAATLGLARAFVVALSTPDERMAYLAYLSAVQFAGAAVMPLVGSLLAMIPPVGVGVLRIDPVTAPAWLVIIAAGLLEVAISFYFDEPEVHQEKPQAGEAVDGDGSALPIFMLVICMANNMIIRGVMAVVETVGTVITSQYFHYEAKRSGLLFGAVGVLALIVFLSIKWISKRWRDATLSIVGTACMAAGFAVIASVDAAPHVALFVVGLTLVWALGSPLGQTAILSLFSRLLGRRKQGQWMGWFTSSGSIARIAFSAASGALYPVLGVAGLASGTAALVLAGVGAQLCSFGRLSAVSAPATPDASRKSAPGDASAGAADGSRGRGTPADLAAKARGAGTPPVTVAV